MDTHHCNNIAFAVKKVLFELENDAAKKVVFGLELEHDVNRAQYETCVTHKNNTPRRLSGEVRGTEIEDRASVETQ